MAKRYRKSSVSVSVDVDVDVCDVLEEIHDDDLKDECERRWIYVNPVKKTSVLGAPANLMTMDWDDLEHDLRAAVRTGDLVHLDVVLLRMKTFAGVPYLMTSGLKRDDVGGTA